jgi:hydrogenase small subunit
LGEIEHQHLTGYEQVRDLGRDAMAVLGVGACASFGGIPAAPPNPTEALPVGELFKRENIRTPLVHIPGCPPHPDWIVGTIAAVLLGGLENLKLDEHLRPAAFFSKTIHEKCPNRGNFDRGDFAERFGDHGCLFKLGCKGLITHADCPTRKFNNGTNWCCQAGHPCIGCCHPRFPFETSMFGIAFDHGLTGQALDESHIGQACDDCHVDHKYGRMPRCDSCHEEGGIRFPEHRPGPVVPRSAFR